jgi:hypothetical protein
LSFLFYPEWLPKGKGNQWGVAKKFSPFSVLALGARTIKHDTRLAKRV